MESDSVSGTYTQFFVRLDSFTQGLRKALPNAYAANSANPFRRPPNADQTCSDAVGCQFSQLTREEERSVRRVAFSIVFNKLRRMLLGTGAQEESEADKDRLERRERGSRSSLSTYASTRECW